MIQIPTHLRRRTAVAVLLAAATVAPAAVLAAKPNHNDRAVVPQLSWQDCGDNLQCATADVPLDHDLPRGEQISLSLARLPATDQAHRIGTLFVNNGGPGNSVIDFMHGDVNDVVPEDVKERFDIVGFDPRGVGESTPVRCFVDSDAQASFFGGLEPFPVTNEEISRATTAARELGERCRELNGDLLDHVSTADVARDLDLLRRAVGDPQLTFAGYSYGGMIGLTYAQLYPERVRATLVDGAPDPTAWMTGLGAERGEPFSVRLDSHEAASDALGFFLDACAAAGSERCAFAAPDTTAKFDALMAELRAGPIVVELPPGPAGPGGPTPISYAFVVDSMRGGLQFPPIWGDIAGLLQVIHESIQAEDAGGTRVSSVVDSDDADDPAADGATPTESSTTATDDYDNAREALLAVSCSETRNPNVPKRWIDAANAADRDAPYFGADFAWLSLPCATWPGRAHDTVQRFHHETANPVMFLNSRFDAASPLERAVDVAEATPGARLLTVEGAGHPASFIPNQCVADAVSGYLIDQTVPADGAVCLAEFQPFS